MQLHRSCVLPSNAPALPDSTIPSRVLQEHSGNRGQGYADESPSWKRSPSSPAENVFAGHSYFTGNTCSQLSIEKSEEQIEHEFKKLLALLQRCEKYQKYRDRQPTTAKEKEQRWPENLEMAFFRALVRWPPMGRRKHMLDGRLRGRNELVADAIEKETGVERDRKQVSSHIQVLKDKLSDQPILLMYMSKEDIGSKKRGAIGHSRSRHRLSSISSKYGPGLGGAHVWPIDGMPYLARASSTQARSGVEPDTPFTMLHFAMLVQDNKGQPIHYVTQIADNPRLPDLHYTDLSSWHKQYPELNFHRTQDWKDRQTLVCHASINITEKQPPGAELAIQYVIEANHDLSTSEPLQCRTRFYDSGELAQHYDETKQCAHASDSSRRLPFGSHFWVRRMSELRMDLLKARRHEDQSLRRKLEVKVQRSLQYMTAVQDVYGTKNDTGEQHCFLTILWRFQQTRTSNEPGRVTWRVVNFPPPAQQPWMKGADYDFSNDLKLILNSTTSDSATSMYTSLDLSHQSFAQHPPPLDIDSLGNMPVDFSNPNSATAPSMATDYSQANSLPSLTHSQDTQAAHSQHYEDANNIDFNGGHITMHLGPAINFGSYDNYGTHVSSLNPISGLESTQPDHSFSELELGATMASCYPNRTWHFNDLISRMEGAAEQTQDLLNQADNGQEIAGHGVLHDRHLGDGLWKLQTPFGEDTVVGAGACMGSGNGTDQAQGILELIERDQREGRLREY